MDKRILRWVTAFLIVLSLLLVVLSKILQPGFDPDKYGTVETDITYCTMDGVDLGIDLYYPESGGPWPALIFIHGGSWMEGDKSGVDTRPADAGYLLASINYRMYPDYRFPAMIEDVKCAVRFLRAHARQYNIDSKHIGLVGHSAGGHLAALAGLSDQSAGWDTGQYLEESSQVQAVISIAGPTNLALSFPGSVRSFLENVFGAEQLLNASPVTHASPDDPPVLIIHGDADRTVPVEQANLLKMALDSKGIPNELLIVKNGGHGLEAITGATVPSGEEVYDQAILFVDQYLKK